MRKVVICPDSLLDKIRIHHQPFHRFVFTKFGPDSEEKKPPKIQFGAYEALHDPNLKHFFKRKANSKHVTNEVIKCSLKELNEYRRELFRSQQDAKAKENEKLKELVDEADVRTLEMSMKFSKRTRARKQRFIEIYADSLEPINHPCKSESFVDVIKRRKQAIEDSKRSKAINNLKRYEKRSKNFEDISYLRDAQKKEVASQKDEKRRAKYFQVKEAQRKRRCELMNKILTDNEALNHRRNLNKRPEFVNLIVSCTAAAVGKNSLVPPPSHQPLATSCAKIKQVQNE